MTEIEAYEYVIQLYPKCGLKTVAVFGMDITPYLKHGFRDVQYRPKEGQFDCAVIIWQEPIDVINFDCAVIIWQEPIDVINQWGSMVIRNQTALCVKVDGIVITDGTMLGPQFIQIHSGKLNAYKRKA